MTPGLCMVLVGERLLGDRQTEGLPKGSVVETRALSPLSHSGWILGRIKLTKDVIWGGARGLPEYQCLQLRGHGGAWGASSTPPLADTHSSAQGCPWKPLVPPPEAAPGHT